MKKLLIFDMDGVIFNSGAIAAKYIKERYPEITKPEEQALLKGNFHEEFTKLKLLYPERIETNEEVSARRLKYSQDKLQAPLYEGMKDLLIGLRKEGHPITLNTSAANDNCIPLLKQNDILRLFDFLATKEVSKSKVEKFLMIQEKYGVETKEILFITDTLGDVREANLADIPTVAVTWGAHDRDYFTQEENKNLIGIIDSVSELKSFIGAY